MKILTLTTDETVCTIFKRACLAIEGSLINYTSPIKLLDNFDEIQPEVIIINAQEFPRHWKVIVQFLFNNPLFSPQIILYSTNLLAKDDFEKTITLKLFTFTDESKLTFYLQSLYMYDQIEKQESPVKCCFINPHNGKLVTGKIIEDKNNMFLFKVDFLDMLEQLLSNMKIENASLQRKNTFLKTNLHIVSIKNDLLYFHTNQM
ncbi:MAG: hypothetical protein ACRC5H_04540 [Treponemataceae bacterium]